MTEDERIEEVIEDWRERCDRGESVHPETILRDHPEIESGLRRRFAALAILDRIFSDSVVTPVSIPVKLGDFRPVREIGRGGMGVVYLAEQVPMRRRVALKVLYPRITRDRLSVERFLREARAAGRLHHTNIVPVHDLDRDGDTWFYAMEFVEGHSLAALLHCERSWAGARAADPDAACRPAASSLSRSAGTPHENSGWLTSALGGWDRTKAWYKRVAEIFAGAADGLQTAHEAGVVHRDVKPSNLLLDLDGRLKLIDFGLAAIESEPSLTGSSERPGTPLYMSPEQARGESADTRTDVWSLGATLYEVLTRRSPFAADNSHQITTLILTEDPKSPRDLDGMIPQDLETITMKCLEKEPGRRYQNAAELASDLRRFAEGGVIGARRLGPLGRLWRRARRQKVRTALFLIAGIATLAAAWLALEVAASRPAVLALARQQRLDRCERLIEQGFSELGHGSLPKAARTLEEALTNNPESTETVAGLALTYATQRRHEDVVRLLDAHPESMREAPTLEHLRAMSRLALGLDPRGLDSTNPNPKALGEPNSAVGCFIAAFFALDRAHRETGNHAGPPGTSASSKEDYGRAQELLYRAIMRSPTQRAVYYFSLAHAAGHTADVPTVNRVARILTTQWPGSALAWSWAAFSQRQLHPEKCLAFHQHAIELNARDPWILQLYAGELERQGLPEKAATQYRRVLGVDSKYGPAWSFLGRTLRTLHRFEEALEAHAEAKRLAPDDVGVLSEYGTTLQECGKNEEALGVFQRAAELEPDQFKVQMNLGLAWSRVGNEERALASYDRAIELAPMVSGCHFDRAIALARLGRLPEARDAAGKAIELDGRNADAHFQLANILILQHRLPEAERHLQTGVALRPQSAQGYNNLGHCQLLQKRIREAARSFRTSVELAPSLPLSRYNLGLALLDLRRPAEALSHLEFAAKADSHDSDFQTCFARCLVQVGRHEEALALTRQVKAAHPENVGLLATLGEIESAANGLAGIVVRMPKISETDLSALDVNLLRGLIIVASDAGNRALAAEAAGQVLKRDTRGRPGSRSRYEATRTALLAGFELLGDAAAAGEEARRSWRRQAEHLIREILARAEEAFAHADALAERCANDLEALLGDPDLARLRTPEVLELLPKAEAKEWRETWTAVALAVSTRDAKLPTSTLGR